MYDLVILNGKVVDGTGKDSKIMNIGINKGTISIITKDIIGGLRVINAEGLIVAPGFIDIHGHSDMVPLMGRGYDSKLCQGVTTEVNGNCGLSPVPSTPERIVEIKEYVEGDFSLSLKNFNYMKINSLEKLKRVVLESENISVKQEYLVGAGAIRIAVMGFENRKATDKELKRMQNLLVQEMEAGALGISFGLIYPPGNFTDIDEIIMFLEIMNRYDGVASFHMRNEGKDLIKSIDEVIEVGRKTKAKVNISHLKIMDKSLWGIAEKIIEKIRKAKDEGIRITFDQYPYEASSTTLQVLLPAEGNFSKKGLLKEIEKRIEGRGGADRIVIASTSGKIGEIEGMNLMEISQKWQTSPEEAVFTILEKSEGKVSAVYFSMNEKDVESILSCKEAMVASDGYSYPFENTEKFGVPHPRSFGTFPRFLRIVREKKLMKLEEAIAKITSIPAEIFKISQRGELKIGNDADITIFDFETIRDMADFQNPFQKPEGIKYVIIDGKIEIGG